MKLFALMFAQQKGNCPCYTCWHRMVRNGYIVGIVTARLSSMGRTAAYLAAIFFAIGGYPVFPLAAQPTSAGECSMYQLLINRARECLHHSDKAGAIEALHRARSSLSECIRQEAGDAEQPVMVASQEPARDMLWGG